METIKVPFKNVKMVAHRGLSGLEKENSLAAFIAAGNRSYFGIECDIQVGFCTNGGGHAWNLVELEGQWYQMDVTWNDSSAKRTDYLLVTDDYMKKSRTWDESDYPKCAPKAYTP